MSTTTISLPNNFAVPLVDLPLVTFDTLAKNLLDGAAAGWRVVSYFGSQISGSSSIRLYLVMADDENQLLRATSADIENDSFPSLSSQCPQVNLFEREIAEQFGVRPHGHPWFKPVRYTRSWTGRDAWNRAALEPLPPAVGDFYRVEGEEVHEVAVGPVHAGVIEPGHFRFQCGGEEVYHLEIALGYQHRGIEAALIGAPGKRSIYQIESLSGDATIAHTTAYCQILEALSGTPSTPRADAIRAIALELERLACHIGDLGALAGDIGYLPTYSFCGRIRGDFLNMSALICGSRFGRGLVIPGGVFYDLESGRADELRKQLDAGAKDAANAIDLLWENQSVMSRFEDTGSLSAEDAEMLGLVGPAARATGLRRDSRLSHPTGHYATMDYPLAMVESGDVYARAYVRWLEIQHSVNFIRHQSIVLPEGELAARPGKLRPNTLSVALNEAWRGELCHVAITDSEGRFARYKVTDPSFHNWQGLAHALRGQAISDFPLCNKSFNLSYCGHDL